MVLIGNLADYSNIAMGVHVIIPSRAFDLRLDNENS